MDNATAKKTKRPELTRIGDVKVGHTEMSVVQHDDGTVSLSFHQWSRAGGMYQCTAFQMSPEDAQKLAALLAKAEVHS